MPMKVPFVDPKRVYRMLKPELDAAYFEVMSKGDLIMRGQLSSFERNLAKFVGVKYAVGLNSGYDALHISLLAAGIGAGDEVIVPAHTFVATCSAVVNAGALPVLVDVGRDFNIDVSRIEPAITPRTRAIMAVHLSGWPADMPPVMKIARKHNLKVIEDACQSLGASIGEQRSKVKGQPARHSLGDGRRSATSATKSPSGHLPQSGDVKVSKKMAGAWGLTGCWSFYPFKILGGYGDGGAITTNDPEVALFVQRMRYNGEDRETGEYHGHGFTCLLDNLQAAFLDVKLRHLPEWIVRRKAIAGCYRQGLSDLPDLLLPHYDKPGFDHVYQNYTLRARQGDDFSEYLKKQGIEVLTQFRKPYYKHAALKLKDCGYPETEALSREVCSLPMNVEITDKEVKHVIKTVRSFYGK